MAMPVVKKVAPKAVTLTLRGKVTANLPMPALDDLGIHKKRGAHSIKLPRGAMAKVPIHCGQALEILDVY